MKKLLSTLVVCGLVVGCGGDTSGTAKSTKVEVKKTDDKGTTKVETKKEESTKVTTDKKDGK